MVPKTAASVAASEALKLCALIIGAVFTGSSEPLSSFLQE